MESEINFPDCCKESEQIIMQQVAAARSAPVIGAAVCRSPVGGTVGPVRAEFVFWLLIQRIPDAGLPATRFELTGARIEGEVDLSASKLGIACCFRQCTFTDPLRLAGAYFPGLELRECTGPLLDAARVRIGGQLTVHKGHFDHIILSGARIRGGIALSCEAGYPDLPLLQDTKAIEADGLRCNGTVDLSGLKSRGEVGLNGCKIGRDLRCHGASISNAGGWSLGAAGATIKGSVYLGARDSDPGPQPAGRMPHVAMDRPAEPQPDQEVLPTTGFSEACGPSTYKGALHLEGITITGDLDAWESRFEAYQFVAETPSAVGTVRPKFEGCLEAIRAGGAKIGGSIKFKKAHARGTVWLADVEVGGNFDCSNAKFDFPGETALWADGIRVAGTTYLSTFFDQSQLTRWVREDKWEGGSTNGILRFVNASLNRGLTVANFEFSGAGTFDNRRADDPQMVLTPDDQKKIYGSQDSNPDGPNVPGQGACGIYAPSCQISGRFMFHRIWTGRNPRRPLLLSLLNAKADVLDYLPAIPDDPGPGWDAKGKLYFNNFEYRDIVYIDPKGASKWLERLDKWYAPDNSPSLRGAIRVNSASVANAMRRWGKRTWYKTATRIKRFRWARYLGVSSGTWPEYTSEFTPNPYLQLAKIVRQAGYDRAADEVLLRLDRNRTRWGDQGAWHQIGGWLYDLAIKRGFAPFRPLFGLIGLWLLSVIAFQASYEAKDFVPYKDNLVGTERLAAGGPAKLGRDRNNEPILVRFDARTYAFELVVPLVTIDGKQNWVFRDPPDADAHRSLRPLTRLLDWLAHGLIVLDPILGWIMTSFLVTGIAGLIRSSRN